MSTPFISFFNFSISSWLAGGDVEVALVQLPAYPSRHMPMETRLPHSLLEPDGFHLLAHELREARTRVAPP
eukprot:15544964-Heterocapsa_arctica.AAC.1